MKNLKNLGIALSKAEQKTINGGKSPCGGDFPACPNGACCVVPPGCNQGYCDARAVCL